MSVDRRYSTANGDLRRHRPINQNVNAGRSGPGWVSCRAEVIRRAGGKCALCRQPLNPYAPAGEDDATEIDHVPPRRIHVKEYESGRISLAEFNARCNNPDLAQAAHTISHINKDVGHSGPTPKRTRGAEWD